MWGMGADHEEFVDAVVTLVLWALVLSELRLRALRVVGIVEGVRMAVARRMIGHDEEEEERTEEAGGNEGGGTSLQRETRRGTERMRG